MPQLKPVRVPISELEPAERVQSFDEVQCGYTLEEALAEADRCLRCPRPLCVQACPAHNDIPGFITALSRGDVAEAASVLSRTSTFPAICGRLCDHARQCEGSCVVRRRGDAVAIGALERFVGDNSPTSVAHGPTAMGSRTEALGRVAIIGAGPAGLAAAGVLAGDGYDVTIFESRPYAGGVLAWGIPTFRLPDAVLRQHVEALSDQGVSFRFGARLGGSLSVDRLLEEGFDAVFLGIGAGTPQSLGIPGEDLPGVYEADAFLGRAKRSQLGEDVPGGAPRVGHRVVVVGAGNTAMDAAQTARRLGAKDVLVLYRRSREEMPARSEEVASAEAEGVRFEFLAAPTRFLAGPDARLQRVECVRMQLGAPGPDGRRRPEPCPDQTFTIEADAAITTLGFSPDQDALASTRGVTRGAHGWVVVDPETGRTSNPRVWAAGDVTTGPATVVGAMAAGRRVAHAMHEALSAVSSSATLCSETVTVTGASD